jgi:hypothetical protein
MRRMTCQNAQRSNKPIAARHINRQAGRQTKSAQRCTTCAPDDQSHGSHRSGCTATITITKQPSPPRTAPRTAPTNFRMLAHTAGCSCWQQVASDEIRLGYLHGIVRFGAAEGLAGCQQHIHQHPQGPPIHTVVVAPTQHCSRQHSTQDTWGTCQEPGCHNTYTHTRAAGSLQCTSGIHCCQKAASCRPPWCPPPCLSHRSQVRHIPGCHRRCRCGQNCQSAWQSQSPPALHSPEPNSSSSSRSSCMSRMPAGVTTRTLTGVCWPRQCPVLAIANSSLEMPIS